MASGELTGMAKLVHQFAVFRTVKMVKIHDKKLILLHQVSLGLAFVYTLFYIFLGHAYMATENPSLSVASVVTGYNTTLKQAALSLAQELETAPLYCNQSSVVHWDYGPQLEWQYPQCLSYLTINEFVDAAPDEVWVYTNFVQRIVTRSCEVPPSVSNASLYDPPADVSLIQVGINCSTATQSYLNAYIFEPESVQFELTPTYSASWLAGALFDELTLMSPAGVPLGTDYVFGSVMTVTLADLLTAAGLDLDSENADSGGLGLSMDAPTPGSNSATTWPSYRTTGVTLRAKVRVSNFRVRSPGNFNVTGNVYVENASPSAWTSPPVELTYNGGNDETYDSIWMERRYQGVRVAFVSEGVIGHPEALTAVNALINCFVIVLVAVAVTDFLGQWLSDEFAAEKFEDDGERAAVDMLLEKEADHGVPFNFEDLRLRQANGELSEECYESAIFRLEKEIEELRQGGARVRSAAVIIAEDIGLPGLLDDTGPPPEPLYKLLSPNGDTILIYPGENVVGRGLGDIRTPTVSRKQICITVDPESKRAFIRSMRAAKAPSIPAIMRSSSQQTNWRPLTQKGQSLNLGDTICMQIKPAPTGQTPGRLNEYRFVALDTAPEREPTFMERLRAQYKIPFL